MSTCVVYTSVSRIHIPESDEYVYLFKVSNRDAIKTHFTYYISSTVYNDKSGFATVPVCVDMFQCIPIATPPGCLVSVCGEYLIRFLTRSIEYVYISKFMTSFKHIQNLYIQNMYNELTQFYDANVFAQLDNMEMLIQNHCFFDDLNEFNIIHFDTFDDTHNGLSIDTLVGNQCVCLNMNLFGHRLCIAFMHKHTHIKKKMKKTTATTSQNL